MESESEDATEETEYLVDLLTYILADRRDKQETELGKWITETKSQLQGVHAISQNLSKPSFINVLLQILRECLITHRYDQAVQVMQGVINHPYYTATAMFRGGLEVLLNTDNNGSNSQPIAQFFNQLKRLGEYPSKEVILEYVWYLMSLNRVKEAAEQFKLVPQHRGSKSQKSVEHVQYMETQYTLYQGMVAYAEWLNIKQELQNIRDDLQDSFFGHSSIHVANEEKMEKLAEKAIECFRACDGQVGVWDIFIIKAVELLEYYDRQDEALAVLQDYVTTNKDNPKAHKYLYELMKRRGDSNERCIEVAKTLVKLVPSDAIVLDLCTMLRQSEQASIHTLPYLFNMLDYACWMECLEPWKMLVEQLMEHVESSAASVHITSIDMWTQRKSWWSQYHFRTDSIKEDSNKDLLGYKAIVCALLVDKDVEYISKVKPLLNSTQKALLQQAVNLGRKQDQGVT